MVAAISIFASLPNLLRVGNLSSLSFLAYQIIGLLGIAGLALFFIQHLKFIPNLLFKNLLWPCFWLGGGIAAFVLISKIFLQGLDESAAGIPPFYARWDYFDIAIGNLANPAVLMLLLAGVTGLVIGWLFFKKKTFSVWVLILLVGLSFALTFFIGNLDVDLITGPNLGESITQVVTVRFTNNMEYYASLNRIEPGTFTNYLEAMPALSPFAREHPPGPLLFLWLLSQLGLNIFGTSLAVALMGSLTLIPIFYAVKELFGGGPAKIAAILFIFVPGVILYSLTSMDIVFMFFAALAVALFIIALARANLFWSLLFGLSLIVAFYMSFTTIFILPFLVLLFLFNLKTITRPWLKAVIMLGSFGGIYYLMMLLLNYNAYEVAQKSLALQAESRVAAVAEGRTRIYAYHLFGNIVNFFVFLGLPLFFLVAKGLKFIIRSIKRYKSAYSLLLCATITWVAWDIFGITYGEVARIWLLLIPIFIIAISAILPDLFPKQVAWAVPLIIAMMFIQTVIMEIYLDTYW